MRKSIEGEHVSTKTGLSALQQREKIVTEQAYEFREESQHNGLQKKRIIYHKHELPLRMMELLISPYDPR